MKPHALFLGALLVAGCSPSLYAASGFDDQLEPLHGTCSIAPSTQADRVEFRLQRGTCEDGKRHCDTSNDDMPLSNFTGFTLSDLKRDGSHLDAVIAAEAGKLTCSGTVHDLTLSGDFTFVPDQAFVARMQQMGFSDFDSEKLEAYTLPRGDLLDSVAAIRRRNWYRLGQHHRAAYFQGRCAFCEQYGQPWIRTSSGGTAYRL
jgi:hypothetical protein